jgi:AbrB family looped-hinge helix DNA binding protein
VLTELRAKAQITLPKALLDKTNIAIGDLLEITERDGGIFIFPVTVVRKRQTASEDKSSLDRREALRSLCGSIDGSSSNEPPEISHESLRETL